MEHVFLFLYKCVVKIQIDLLFSIVEGDRESVSSFLISLLALTHVGKTKQLTEALVIHLSLCPLLKK